MFACLLTDPFIIDHSPHIALVDRTIGCNVIMRLLLSVMSATDIDISCVTMSLASTCIGI